MERVKKTWGNEITIVNKSYCGKILEIDKGAYSSIHMHPRKDETFLCLEGEVLLVVGDKAFWLKPWDEAVHVVPSEWHMFVGLEQSKMVEFSTIHEDSDVERRTESKPGSPGR